MKHWIRLPFGGGRLLYVLLASFILVAALAASLNALVTSRVINTYLLNAQTDRLQRDLDLTNGFYQQKLDAVNSLSQFVALDPQTVAALPAALRGDQENIRTIDEVVSRMIAAQILDGTRTVVVLDLYGNVLTGRSIPAGGKISSPFAYGNWSGVPVVAEVLASKKKLVSTEVIPDIYLAQVGLDKQAHIVIQDTPQASSKPFDPSEGTAGLAIVGVYPLLNESGQISGAVLTAYLFNNDFSLVDYIKNEAKVETMTIFQGDLRVSTNVPDSTGGRAVGTRVSQDVYQKVLVQGQNYSGRVFVVNNWYIGSYEPLRDSRNTVVGMIYAGVRETVFDSLVVAFNTRAALIAFVCILVAGVIAIPIARLITKPIASLVEANRRLAKGDMNVRVESAGKGEIAMLGRSFNSMVETLEESEKELLHQAKLASVGQLAAGVAHELNNPLGTILLYSDMMFKEMPEGDARRDDLKMIISEVHRCKTIVADLLNFARQHEITAKDVDLHALLEDVILKAQTRPRYEKIQFVREFDPNLPLIQADASQLQQVFVNLFNNSNYAMENAGMITISTHCIEPQSVEIRVSDTGSGIPAENLSKLFTPFFTTKPAGKGTGLGLSIVYGIIKLHHGQITVQSQVGHGTTFTITLPVRLSDGGLTQTISSKDLIG
jgi:two-component system, NtrC family, sensor kinase